MKQEEEKRTTPDPQKTKKAVSISNDTNADNSHTTGDDSLKVSKKSALSETNLLRDKADTQMETELMDSTSYGTEAPTLCLSPGQMPIDYDAGVACQMVGMGGDMLINESMMSDLNINSPENGGSSVIVTNGDLVDPQFLPEGEYFLFE